VAIDDATVTATRFRVSASGVCGVQLARGGFIDLHDGEVSRNPVGANVQTVGFDVARLQDRVLYRDNEQTLDTAGLLVPEPAAF